MMNRGKQFIRKVLQGYIVGVMAMLVCLLLASLVLSIYVDGVEGLLTSRGIRWMCSSIVSNFASLPLAQIFLGLMAISVLRESGIFSTLSGHISMKQRRALQITGIVALLVIALFLLLIFMPDAVLLSAFGTISHSALSKGLFGLTAIMAALIGNLYGYTSGRFTTIHHHLQAHTSILATSGGCFVLLFLSSQFLGCIEFTGILPHLGDDGTILSTLKALLYYLPLLLYLILSL